MDLVVSFLVLVVILSIVFLIIKYLIMPIVPAPAQAAVWAILGLILLIAFLGWAYNNWSRIVPHHGL